MTSSEVRRYVEEDEQLTSSCYITAKPSKWAGLDIYSCVKPSTQAVGRLLRYSIMQPGSVCKLCEVLEAHMWVTKMNHTTGQGEKRAEVDKLYDAIPAWSYCLVLLHEMVHRFKMFLGHKRVTKLTYLKDQGVKGMMYAEPCTTESARTSSMMFNTMCSAILNMEYRVENYIYEVPYSNSIAVNSITKGAEADINTSRSVGHKKVNKLTKPTGQEEGGVECATQCDVTAAIVILERGRQMHVQLSYSCYNIIKRVGAESISLVFAQARAYSITTIVMQPGTKYKLCEVLGAHMCVGYMRVIKMTHSTGQEKKSKEDKLRDTAPPKTCSLMYAMVVSIQQYHTCYYVDRLCREVLHEAVYKNSMYEASYKQCKVGSHRYEALHNPQFCYYVDRQCREVDVQMGSAVTIQTFGRDEPMLRKVKFTMHGNQGMANKTV